MEHDPDGARGGVERGLDPVSVYFILFLVRRWRKILAGRRFAETNMWARFVWCFPCEAETRSTAH